MAEVTFSRKLVAEFLGTGTLVLGGPGSVAATFLLINGAKGTKTEYAFDMAHLGMIAFAFMLVIAALVYAIGHISGCQINPAATLALAVSKRMPWSEVPGYMLAQFLGAIAGAFAIWGTLGAAGLKAGLGSLSFASPVTPGQAFFVELLGTFLLVIVILGSAVDDRATPGWAGLAIGSYVFVAVVIWGPITGPAINPARYVGPYVVSSIANGKVPASLSQIPVYLVADFIGGLLGAAMYAYIGAVKKSKVVEHAAAERVGVAS
jgi:glycerol uptake facilitator protein